jgi:hypothetical protein
MPVLANPVVRSSARWNSSHSSIPAGRRVAACLGFLAMVAGCATASRDVPTAHVSPLQYGDYDCSQIAAEKSRVQTRLTQMGARLDEASSNDKALVGVGVLLFWPALFALGGTKEQEAEYGRLKGEYEALEKTAVQKNCTDPAAPRELVATGASSPASAPASPPPATPAFGSTH